MNVIFGVDRHIEIEDMRQPLNIEAPCRHVTGNQHPRLTQFEFVEGIVSCALGHVTMQGEGIKPVAFQRRPQRGDIALPVTENHGIGDVFLIDQVTQGFTLRLGGGHDHKLVNRVSGCSRGGDFDYLGVNNKFGSDLVHLLIESRRIEQRLSDLGQQAGDAFNIGDKAHVHHPVRLINHQHLDIAEHDLAALNMVEQAAGGCDQNIHAFVEGGFLFVKTDPADQQRHGKFLILAETGETFGYLGGQFTRRGQDQ